VIARRAYGDPDPGRELAHVKATLADGAQGRKPSRAAEELGECENVVAQSSTVQSASKDPGMKQRRSGCSFRSSDPRSEPRPRAPVRDRAPVWIEIPHCPRGGARRRWTGPRGRERPELARLSRTGRSSWGASKQRRLGTELGEVLLRPFGRARGEGGRDGQARMVRAIAGALHANETIGELRPDASRGDVAELKRRAPGCRRSSRPCRTHGAHTKAKRPSPVLVFAGAGLRLKASVVGDGVPRFA